MFVLAIHLVQQMWKGREQAPREFYNASARRPWNTWAILKFMNGMATCTRTAVAWVVFFFGSQGQPQAPPANPLNAARHSIAAGQFQEADKLLRAELNRSPDSAEAHFLLGLVLFHENRPGDSLAEYTAGARLRTPRADELIGVASDYILMKDYGDADRWLTRATQLAPGLAKGWYLLGRTQYNENRIVDAERSFQACLHLDALNVKAEYNLGLVYEKSDRPDQAIAAYKQAITWQENASTKDPQPSLDLGMLLQHQGHFEQALPYLLAAEAAGPRNPLTHAQVGLCDEQLNRLDDAIAELKQALMLSPNVEAVHFFLGRVYRRAGRTGEAATEFAAAAKLSGQKSNDGIPNEEVNPQ